MPIDRLRPSFKSVPGREHSWGLRLQLLAILTLSLSPLLVLSVAQGVMEFRDESSRQRDSFHSILIEASADLSAEIDRASGVVTALANYPDIATLRGPRCAETLRAVQAAQPIYSNVKLIDRDGRIACAAVETVDENNAELSGLDWFARLEAGEEEAYSDIYLDWWTVQRPVMTVARRLEVEGEFAGAITVDIDPRRASDLLRTQDLPSEMRLALSDADGNLSYIPDNPSEDRLTRLPEAAMTTVRETGEPVLVENLEGAPGRSLLVAPLAGRDIQLVLVSPSLLLGSWAGFDIVGTVLLPSLMWLLALLCVSLAVDFFVLRWLSYLGRMARLYGAGRLGLQPVRATRAPVEIRTLAETMASMANDLEARTEELETEAEQRGALLREIHHRVKNNLQVTMSLLNIQGRRTSDVEARRVLAEAGGRINALALVHRTLYENDDLRVVEMRPFLEQLLYHLRQASTVYGCDVDTRVEADHVELDPDIAIPAALFITEAVTNAYKHAFDAETAGPGLVTVSLERLEDGMASVSVCDNGKGYAEGASSGMGSSLMEALAQRLGGELERSDAPGGGACVTIRFET
jgi:two-component sensor histidine kinase